MATDPQFVAALSHGLAILSCFTSEQPVLTNSALARLTSMPRSSVSRLTHTLVKVGFLDYESVSGAYRLGLGVLSLQPAALAGTQLERFGPHLNELAQRVGGRVLLAAYERFGLTVVQGVCTDPHLPAPRCAGYRYPLPRRAMGRAYLASCGGQEQEQIVVHLADGSENVAMALRSELDLAVRSFRSQGYCTCLGESRPGNHSISISLNVPHLGRRLLLACGGPADHFSERVLHDRVAPSLMLAAAQIERTSGSLASLSAVRPH